MPTADATNTPMTQGQMIANDHYIDSELQRHPGQSVFLARLAETVLQIPPLIQIYCSSPTGPGVHGLLKSVSPTGIQVVVPTALPIHGLVRVTIGRCHPLVGEVLYCVKKSNIYHAGIVFSVRHKPEISVGCVAVVTSLEEPLTLTRGNVLDVGRTRLSILCKTMLVPGAWVRVEANGWVLFGLVEAVVATSMLACCVDIHLEAAFPAAIAETMNSIPPTNDCEDGLPSTLEDCLASC